MQTYQKEDIRSYLNPFPPHHSEAAQLKILTGTIYKEDKTGKIIDRLIQSVRKGSIIEVTETFLLAPTKGRTSKRREILVERFDRIEAKGGVVWCRATNTRSSNRADHRRMLLRAYELMGKSGQGAPGKRKEGRPATPWTKHELDIMEGQWHSARNKNGDIRRAKMKERLGKEPPKLTWLRNKFGAPGKH